MDVSEEESKIIISTEKSPEAGQIEIDITHLDRDSFMYLIRVLFIRGYDEIKLIFNKPTVMHHRIGKEVRVITEIHKEVNRLTGIEVIQQRETFCVLKVLSQTSVKDFELILRRIYLLILDASQDLIQGAKKNDKHLVESMDEKHNTITKFMSNGLRVLNKHGHPNHKNTPTYYFIIQCLDNINDILKDCAREIIIDKIKISPGGDAILKRVNQALIDHQKSFYKFDFKEIERLSAERYQIREEIRKFCKKANPYELILVMYMQGVIERIIDLNIARMAAEY